MTMDEDLVAWGRYLRIETRGRRSGEAASAVVGFVRQPDGSLVVAAGNPNAHWALNLLIDSACTVTVGSETFPARAALLKGPAHADAVRDLILRYGTPSEGLGDGPAFRLVPLTETAG